jgi:hypothetical protein
MPITVVCPSCKTRFNVSDKFAGKQGPCPKCKVVLTVPKLEEQVQIHAPEEFASGGKDAKGRPITKPIARTDTKFKPKVAAAIGGVALVVFAVAYFLGDYQFALLSQETWLAALLRFLGLLVISPAIVAGAYTFMSDPELEPYKGRDLWKRCGLCSLGYIAIWIGCWYIPGDLLQEVTIWLFILPPILLVGSAVAFVCLDLDFQSCVFHYSFYLLVTLALLFTAGLDIHWSAPLGPS